MNLKEMVRNLPADKRKPFFFGLAVVAALLFLLLPSPAALKLSLLGATRAQPVRAAYPGAVAPGAADTLSAASSALPVQEALLGRFAGRAMLRRGLCTISMELHQQPGQERPYTGYASLQCARMGALARAGRSPATPEATLAAVTSGMTPISSVLSGVVERGALQFAVEKNIGANPEGGVCEITSYTVSPFGSNQIAVEWRDGTCGGGQMLLQKVGR